MTKYKNLMKKLKYSSYGIVNFNQIVKSAKHVSILWVQKLYPKSQN